LSAQLNYANIPVMEGALQYVQQNMVPDATYRNWNGCSSKVKFEKGVNVMDAFKLLPDPQTNGGILVAVAPAAADVVKKIMQDSGLENFLQPIGQMTAPQDKTVIVA
jgi:selenide, water dikinase